MPHDNTGVDDCQALDEKTEDTWQSARPREEPENRDGKNQFDRKEDPRRTRNHMRHNRVHLTELTRPDTEKGTKGV